MKKNPKPLIWIGFFCGFTFFLAAFLQLIRKMENNKGSLTGSALLLFCGLLLMLISYLQLRRLGNDSEGRD